MVTAMWSCLNVIEYAVIIKLFVSEYKCFLDVKYKEIEVFININNNNNNNNTGCPRRNVSDFGRVFLMLKYTDITQNTYIQS
jgi:hypothetical protein